MPSQCCAECGGETLELFPHSCTRNENLCYACVMGYHGPFCSSCGEWDGTALVVWIDTPGMFPWLRTPTNGEAVWLCNVCITSRRFRGIRECRHCGDLFAMTNRWQYCRPCRREVGLDSANSVSEKSVAPYKGQISKWKFAVLRGDSGS